jgi:hypothetical protein
MIHTHTARVTAQVAFAAAAIAAMTTHEMTLSGNSLAKGEPCDRFAQFNNFAHELVTDLHGNGDIFL